MFLLLLMGLGAAGVKAQVRIGGSGTPNAAAVLDLNVDDTNTGTKGLALPRVSLTNVSTPLTGTPVVNGMMIYNTNVSTTGGSGVGIYYWDGSSSKWVKVINSDFTVPLSKIQTSRADSGLYLISNGNSVSFSSLNMSSGTATASSITAPATPVTWTRSLTFTVNFSAHTPLTTFNATVNGMTSLDHCFETGGFGNFLTISSIDRFVMISLDTYGASTAYFTCYRPSA